jgi:hypothetical protein
MHEQWRRSDAKTESKRGDGAVVVAAAASKTNTRPTFAMAYETHFFRVLRRPHRADPRGVQVSTRSKICIDKYDRSIVRVEIVSGPDDDGILNHKAHVDALGIRVLASTDPEVAAVPYYRRRINAVTDVIGSCVFSHHISRRSTLFMTPYISIPRFRGITPATYLANSRPHFTSDPP